MQIEFNKVTWYSKTAAAILFFVVLPLLIFYIVNEYKEVKFIQNLSVTEVNNGSPTNSQSSSATSSPEALIKTNLYLISARGLASGAEPVGCGDFVSPLPVSIPETTEPLKDTFEKLLTFDPQKEYGSDTFTSPVAKMGLKFDGATIVGGTAKINLSGNFSLSGVCESPRIQAQLEKTALQFNTIKKVEIYINGKMLSSLLLEE